MTNYTTIITVFNLFSVDDYYCELTRALNKFGYEIDYNDFKKVFGDKAIIQITVTIVDNHEKMEVEYVSPRTGEILTIVQQ